MPLYLDFTMNMFETRPRFFQWIFGVLLLTILVIGSLIQFYRTTSPTDENLFVDPKSFAYVAENPGPDTTIHRGDLILAVQGVSATTPENIDSVMRIHRNDRTLKVRVLHALNNTTDDVKLSKENFDGLQLRKAPPYVLVVGVTDGGASDRAGMKVGDLILSINGQTFNTAIEANEILLSGHIGKNYVYTVLRGDNNVDLQVKLASIGIPLASIGFSLAGLLFLGTGVFLALKRPELKGARYLALACLLAAAGALIFPGTSGAFRGFIFFLSVSGMSTTFASALFFDSLNFIPQPPPPRRLWSQILLYVFGFIPLICAAIFQRYGFTDGRLLQFVASFLVMLPFFRSQSPDRRRILKPFLTTSLMVFVALVLLQHSISNELFNVVGPILICFLPLALLYSIGRDRIFDLSVRIRKNIQFSFASALWLIVVAGLFIWLVATLPYQHLRLPNVQLTGTSIEVLTTPLEQTEQILAEKTVLMIAAILLAVLFWRVGRWGYDFLTSQFYRGSYDYRRSASEMADVMGMNLNMEDLARGIAEKLSEMMSLKRVGVMFFRNQQTCCCQVAHGFDDTKWREFCLTQSNTMAGWLKPFTKEFAVDSLLAGIRPAFRSQEIQIVVPIRSKDKLVGALLIGEKRSETAFHQEDYEFLSATAKQASVAVENSFLYEELAEQERMKHELGIARQIQLSSLPQTTPKIEGLEIAGMSVPAFEVGGDYFDYLNGEADTLTVIVGDVSGKGTSAALYMSKVQGILHSLHSFGLPPRELFIRANTVLRNDLSQKAFVTAFGAAFNVKTKTINLARAGHLPLYHFDSSAKKVQKILPKGLGMGMSPENIFAENLEEQTIRYSAGDVFVFVTDGITEGRTLDNEEYGDARLVTLFNESVYASAGEIRDKILAAVKEFAGDAQQHDDQTVVVVKAV